MSKVVQSYVMNKVYYLIEFRKNRDFFSYLMFYYQIEEVGKKHLVKQAIVSAIFNFYQ